MNSLSRRLRKVEIALHPQPTEYRGRYEIHHLEAWPDCEGVNGMQQCLEHPPSCGVSVTLIRSPERRALILSGIPWQGILD